MRVLFWNDMRDAELTRRWSAGESSYEIGKAMINSGDRDSDAVLVRTRARRLKLKPRALSNRWYPAEEDRLIRAAWEAGRSAKDIGKELGRSAQSISDAFRRLGFPRRSPRQRAEMQGLPFAPAKPKKATRAASTPRRTSLQVVSSNPDPRPRASRPEWAGVPYRVTNVTPRKLCYCRRFLKAGYRVGYVAYLFDLDAADLKEALAA